MIPPAVIPVTQHNATSAAAPRGEKQCGEPPRGDSHRDESHRDESSLSTIGAAQESALIGSSHLWSSLSSVQTARRTEPAKGADLLGERVSGWIANRRMRKPDWTRVNVIIKRATSLENHSQAAFDDAVAAARDSVLMNAHHEESINLTFAVCCEAIRRELGLRLHPQQVLGALALARGCCAEMATGEGKTLTAILPATLGGWIGKGVHIITVNDYLARRDAQTTSAVYQRLGISVGVIQESTVHADRRRAYSADITYCSDKQIIFDYLRDRLATPLVPHLSTVLLDGLLAAQGADPNAHWSRRVVMRGLFSAIIDEADSVLIDEAITPAIISLPGRSGQQLSCLGPAAAVAAKWQRGVEYTADLRLRVIQLTTQGRALLTDAAASFPPFWSGPRRSEEALLQALTAKDLYRKGDDYVISDGKLMIVDRSTGRILPGRQWQLGLHQAVETKEGVEVSEPTTVAARSAYQAFYQSYKKLCGMSGTLREVAPELWRWYRLPVISIPTHKPVARTMARDRVFRTQAEKLTAAAARASHLCAQGRPVLLGAWSVVTSELVSALLTGGGITHEVLNAVREPQEAAIIARAGTEGVVTVATNMAGRGTDIILTPISRKAGGLAVIATERHEESRVDRQLAGRAGRQGDPGSVETFVSLEDKLVTQNGLWILRWVTFNAPPLLRSPLARLLWWQAQRSASHKWLTVRSQVAQADAWLEMALHHVTK